MKSALPWLLNFSVVAGGIMAFYTVVPLIETRLFPVFSKFRILEVKETSIGVEALIEIRKERNCAPQGYAWYTTDFGPYLRKLDVTNLTNKGKVSSTAMPVGTMRKVLFLFEGITAADVSSLYAETFSRCHPFWITRSVVFP